MNRGGWRQPAMAVALVALISSLAGGAVAARLITGADVKNSSLTGRDVKNNSLTGRDVKGLKNGDIRKGSLKADRFAPGELPTTTTTGGNGGDGGSTPVDAYTKAESDARYVAAGGASLWMTLPGVEKWQGIDTTGDHIYTSTSFNGGSTIRDKNGAEPRAAGYIGSLRVPTVLDGHAPKIVALRVCWLARPDMRMKSWSLERYSYSDLDNAGLAKHQAVFTESVPSGKAECRRTALTTPYEIGPNDLFSFSMEVTVAADTTLNHDFALYSVGVETTS